MAWPTHLSSATHRIAALLLCVVVSGCKGKSLLDDNPVFTAAPPRHSLSNSASAVNPADATVSNVLAVSYEKGGEAPLTGNSVVAQVNGTPVFVDDLIGSLRLAIESDQRLTPEQRQQILEAQVKSRLDSYLEQEVVIHALNQAIPEDRRKEIDKSLEEPFQEVIANIKRDRKVETDAQLNEILAEEGLSIDLLRESFFRIQKVNGYLSTISSKPGAVDRADMVTWYQEHLSDFTSSERVRWQEVVITFAANGGRKGAEEKMIRVVNDLQQNRDFGEVALELSDALSAEKRGDMGWLERGGLADKELENTLFGLQSGQMTKVFVRPDRFEVYRVVDHQYEKTKTFQEVQKEIEQKITREREQEARRKAMEEIRSKATVVTMFDENPRP